MATVHTVHIDGSTYRCTGCTEYTFNVPARKSHLVPDAHRRRYQGFDPSSAMAEKVRLLALRLESGEYLFVTTAWAAFLFREAMRQGQDFDGSAKPEFFSYDRNCADFYRMSLRAYKDGQCRAESTFAPEDPSRYCRLPYMIHKERLADGVLDVEIVRNTAALDAVLRQVPTCELLPTGVMPPERSLRPQFGDVLATSRTGGLYEHFGICVGEDRVIHYAAQGGRDFGSSVTIHEAPMREFCRLRENIQILTFPEKPGVPSRLVDKNRGIQEYIPEEAWFFKLAREYGYHLFTPQETVARARSRLGENKYFLPVNNCEHFALWCKTGMSESHQVNAWLSGGIRLAIDRFLPRARVLV